MNLGSLHRIGRHLQEAAAEAMRAVDGPELSKAQRAVQADVFLHPGTSVGGIAARTGYTQGHVSACVARLAELGRLQAAPDPAERRRTVVDVVPAVASAIAGRIRGSADGLLAEILDQPGPERLREVIEVLDLLDTHLQRHAAARPPKIDRHPAAP